MGILHQQGGGRAPDVLNPDFVETLMSHQCDDRIRIYNLETYLKLTHWSYFLADRHPGAPIPQIGFGVIAGQSTLARAPVGEVPMCLT